MAADLIIYAVIAAALVFWLKNILGTRNGEERDRDNPFAPRNDNAPEVPGTPARPLDDLAHIPTMIPRPAAATGPDPLKLVKSTLVNRVRIETPMAEQGLRAIVAADPNFSLEKFMEGAEAAFEWVVVAFAKGDRPGLQGLLAPSVYQDFDRAITDRQTRGETVETKIEGVRGMDVISATLKGSIAYIAVRFTAQEICIVRNSAGVVVAGAADQTTTMIDLWTFGRDVARRDDPTWLLHETRDERAEDHKTPLPESTR